MPRDGPALNRVHKYAAGQESGSSGALACGGAQPGARGGRLRLRRALRQWATGAQASSEYGNSDWSAAQATGAPNTEAAGDCVTAWASTETDGGDEWLELTYDRPVNPTAVRIRETFNPGAVTKVEAQDGGGTWHTVWAGKDGTKDCPGWLTVTLEVPEWTTRKIKLTLDSAAVPGWNEIDAVELIGEADELPEASKPPEKSPANP